MTVAVAAYVEGLPSPIDGPLLCLKRVLVCGCVGEDMQQCRTIERNFDESKPGREMENSVPCSFPFKSEGILFHDCTQVDLSYGSCLSDFWFLRLIAVSNARQRMAPLDYVPRRISKKRKKSLKELLHKVGIIQAQMMTHADIFAGNSCEFSFEYDGES